MNVSLSENLSPQALILDDNEAIRKLLSRQLLNEGISTLATGSEAEAFKILLRPEVKLLIQDFTREPGTMGGYHFYEYLQSCPIRRHIPIIIISGTNRSVILREIYRHTHIHVDELFILFAKPFSFECLKTLVPTMKLFLDLPQRQLS